jgi:hypothetical protein
MAYQDNPKDRAGSDTESVSEFIAQHQEHVQDVEAAAIPERKVSYSSLPNKGQLAILCLARMADPLATASIQVCFDLKPETMR